MNTSAQPASERPTTSNPAVRSTDLLAAAIQWLNCNIGCNGGQTVTEATTWKDLQDHGMDSLDQVELVMHVEEECDCMIEDAWIEELEARPQKTLKEMAEFIARNL